MKPLRYRKQFRLKNYDYSQNGYYFVTICTKYQDKWFGEIINGEMILSEIGKMAKKYWLEIPKHYPNIKLDEYVIMPNHVHGILIAGAMFPVRWDQLYVDIKLG